VAHVCNIHVPLYVTIFPHPYFRPSNILVICPSFCLYLYLCAWSKPRHIPE